MGVEGSDEMVGGANMDAVGPEEAQHCAGQNALPGAPGAAQHDRDFPSLAGLLHRECEKVHEVVEVLLIVSADHFPDVIVEFLP